MGLAWVLFSYVTQAAFLAVQGSMVVFLLRRGRTEKSFRHGFFILFISVTIADGAFVVMVRSAHSNLRRPLRIDEVELSKLNRKS